MSDFAGHSSAWLAHSKALLESAIDAGFAQCAKPSALLHEAMVYACAGGGKRMRGLLVLASAQAVGASVQIALPAACAIEAMHAYSLVHDDLPCMDDDDLRRGKPTCHRVYGEAMALLAGDALQTLAFQWLAHCDLPAASVLRQVQVLAVAAGVAGMAGGQALDIAAVNQRLQLEPLKTMHACKTGALFRASVQLGALCSPAIDEGRLQALDQYAEALGLAFQVVDDILDVSAGTHVLGKTAGKDAADNKPTMVSLLGMSQAKELAATLAGQAIDALQELGPQAAVLRHIIEQVTDRQS
jgi:farnesyl diphosphate synthase